MIVNVDDENLRMWDENDVFFRDFVRDNWDHKDPMIRLAARFKETGHLKTKYKWKAWIDLDKQKSTKIRETSRGISTRNLKGNQIEKCVLCPSSIGPFQSTACGRLVHKLCAKLMPGTKLVFDEDLGPLVKLNVPHERWGLFCLACRRKGWRFGACIQCVKCSLSIHSTCADKMNLLVLKDGILRFYWY